MKTLLSLFAGDQTLALRFLKEIHKTVPGQITSLDQAIRSADLVLAGRLVHGFKTQLRYTDAYDLAREAEELERALDRAELPDPSRLQIFIQELDNWVDRISETIAIWSRQINPPQ